MRFAVHVTSGAVKDLAEIDEYISIHDSPERAEYLLGRIEETLNKLADLPERGSYPKELSALGIREYREIYFKPYRIIYRIIDDGVYIYLIASGRRDMQDLLSRRLLED